MPSDLGHALLGLLARRPSTGYELARRMQRPVGFFWTAGHSQVYPELARLADAGLVEHEEVPGRGPRPTKRYRPTAAGLDALRAWVVADLEPQPVRDLEVLRLWSLWVVEPEAAAGLVERVRRRPRRASSPPTRPTSPRSPATPPRSTPPPRPSRAG